MKSLKLIALVLIVATFACLLASCSKTLSGTYVLTATDIELGSFGGSKTTLTFSGNKITAKVTTNILGQETTQTKDGTYKIEKNDKGELTMVTTYMEDGKETSSTVSFEEVDKDTIKIAGITYKKEK